MFIKIYLASLKMNLFNIIAVLISIFIATKSYAYENCWNIKNIIQKNACESRNSNNIKQDRINEDAAKSSRRIEVELSESNKINRDKLRLQLLQLEEQKLENFFAQWQQNQTRINQLEKEKLFNIATVTSVVSGLINYKYINKLSELGKCKEARNFIQKGAHNSEKFILNISEIHKGMIAESCDKNFDMARSYYSRAYLNGSKEAATFLERIDEINLLSKKIDKENITTECKVKDADLSGNYYGECRDGFADGKGIAKGRDEYEGTFLRGDTHGNGKYVWGASSKWYGEEYTGGTFHNKKQGFGISTMLKHLNNEKYFPETGFLKDDKYVVNGLFFAGEIVLICESPNRCLEELNSRVINK